jgi:putative redox protein
MAERMSFESTTGPRLSALLDVPEGPVRGWGLFSHGFTLGKDFPGVRAVVTVGAPSDPSHVEHQYDALVDRVLAEGEAEWMVGGRALTLKRAFVEDVRNADLEARISQLGLPLLVMHSPTDDTVDIANASEIFLAARHPRSFVSLEGSDHLLVAPGQARRAARIISAWADQYLQDDDA